MNIRKMRALQTKERLATIALELFHERGFNNVTVDEIIEKASSSKGAFYTHFKSKHDIFAEKFKEIDSFYVQELFPKLEKIDTVIEKLKAFLSMQMQYIETDIGWDVTRTIYEQELNTERTSFFLNPNRPLYDFLRNLFEEGIQTGELCDDLPVDQLVTILARVMRGILYDWSISKGSFSLAKEQEALFKITIEGLEKKQC